MNLKEKFAKIAKEAGTLEEAFYQMEAEYLFRAYEYLAFERMLALKWQMLANQQ